MIRIVTACHLLTRGKRCVCQLYKHPLLIRSRCNSVGHMTGYNTASLTGLRFLFAGTFRPALVTTQ
jgi:hypothetical protein